MMNSFSYALSLGSNLGDRAQNLRRAVKGLEEIASKVCISPIYETAPMYVADQPMFLNMAVTLVSCHDPESFLPELKSLEQSLGRVTGIRHGPRLVDMDIILCGDVVLESEALSVPHLAFRERDFVLRPLLDIAADWIDPKTLQSVAELAEMVQSDTVQLYEEAQDE